ncbi:hypothetical protein QJS66_04415 [Kocuria rhizophila]|nr:hypothetical protein QJS66_04415 [Kocuria rhizophila]
MASQRGSRASSSVAARVRGARGWCSTRTRPWACCTITDSASRPRGSPSDPAPAPPAGPLRAGRATPRVKAEEAARAEVRSLLVRRLQGGLTADQGFAASVISVTGHPRSSLSGEGRHPAWQDAARPRIAAVRTGRRRGLPPPRRARAPGRPAVPCCPAPRRPRSEQRVDACPGRRRRLARRRLRGDSTAWEACGRRRTACRPARVQARRCSRARAQRVRVVEGCGVEAVAWTRAAWRDRGPPRTRPADEDGQRPDPVGRERRRLVECAGIAAHKLHGSVAWQARGSACGLDARSWRGPGPPQAGRDGSPAAAAPAAPPPSALP